MNSTTTTKRRLSLALVCCLGAVDAGIVTMGFNKKSIDNLEDLYHTFETTTRKLQQEDTQALEDEVFDHELDVNEFLAVQEQLQEVVEVDSNTTTAEDEDEETIVDFFELHEENELEDEPEDEPEEPLLVADESLSSSFAEGRIEPVDVGTINTGPRGDRADRAPRVDPTEISFMIVMDEFRYSRGVESLDDISIGTKLGFKGRIVTKAEELGVASGTCTVTSNFKKELSYCDIYHTIETDSLGGFGSIMVSGTADEVGGRLLVTGTGGSLQSTSSGYALVQFDPAGNAVLYVLVKLF